MSKSHNSESEGSNPRDHHHTRPHFLKRAHKDWRVWCAVILMLLAMLVYVKSVDLSLVPGRPATQPVP